MTARLLRLFLLQFMPKSNNPMNKNNLEQSDFLLYTAPDGEVKIEVFFAEETVWLTQKRMAELFGVDVRTVSEHLQNVFSSGELERDPTIRKIRIVQDEGGYDVRRNVDFYNLDAIISVGYRVNSVQATQFRIWATKTLRQFIIKGFALDDERLKNGQHFGKDYFDELLERIREIRASERRFYQKIADIYATSMDYSKDAPLTKEFYAVVQNKLHWGITGKTAAEIVYSSADANKPYMGLTSWKNAPSGKILKSDTKIAKNYLDKKQIGELERLVSAFLDLAENRASRQIVMKMNDWAGFLDRFLNLSEYPVLESGGKISHAQAEQKAGKEYDKFRPIQDRNFVSDFDHEAKRLERRKKDTPKKGGKQ